MSNLLVVDWDMFFPNPMDAGDANDPLVLLYDWGHREAPFMIGPIWHTRAVGFVRNDLPLPTVNEQWRTFPDRFRLSGEAELWHADSNAYAGLLLDEDDRPFDNVVLFDAHHDCGYRVESYVQWERELAVSGGEFSCEDWMLLHQQRGSALHYRFPAWHQTYVQDGVRVPDGVLLDARVDDGESVTDWVFDAVFVCRSGAWVPPWCDGQFEEFLDSWGLPSNQMDQEPVTRDWSYTEESLRETARMEQELMAQAQVLAAARPQ